MQDINIRTPPPPTTSISTPPIFLQQCVNAHPQSLPVQPNPTPCIPTPCLFHSHFLSNGQKTKPVIKSVLITAVIVVNQAWQTFHWGLNGYIIATSLARPLSFFHSHSPPLSLFYQASGQWATNTRGLFRLLDTLCPLLEGGPPGKLILIQNQFGTLSLFPPLL